ncbi:hypothetical protein [Massilia suwonensis]|uniref:Uncharacterized protein n=1 Tax=Massilia suwonensis TaxID=648895 RepID=A0ABW0MTA7_9BURK
MDFPSHGTAETIQALTTAAGIVLAGAWAFWRWSLSEYLRRRREIPSFEGEMFARAVPLAEGLVVLTVSCRWKNTSPVPLPVNTQTTGFTVFEVPATAAPGPIGPRLGNVVKRDERWSWAHWPTAVMEPHTCSELQAHFVVKDKLAYILVCRLEAATKPGEIKLVWARELVWTPDQVTHDADVLPNPSIDRSGARPASGL